MNSKINYDDLIQIFISLKYFDYILIYNIFFVTLCTMIIWFNNNKQIKKVYF